MEAVIQTDYKIIYNGKDITKDITPYVEELSYEDTTEDKASCIDLTLNNESMRWANEWYPEKGDNITLFIGEMNCGTFTIDQNKLKGPPDRIVIQALENMITEPIRTKKNSAHENKSLQQLAQAVAKANKLTLVGTLPNIIIERVTQRHMTDLKWLRKISYDFGVIFSVRDKKLIYTSLYEIDKAGPSFTVDKTGIKDYELTDKTSGIFKACTVSYHVPKKREVISQTVTAADVVTVRNNDGIDYRQITTADTLVVHRKVENAAQAQAMAKAALYRANSQQQAGSIKMKGNKYVLAGNNFEQTGLGAAGSGIFNIQKAKHTVTPGNGWEVDVEVIA